MERGDARAQIKPGKKELIMKTKGIAILLALLCALSAGSVVLSALSLRGQGKVRAEIAQVADSGEDPAQEDGVKIADIYEIKSTKQISDAYRAGSDSALNDRDRETLALARDVIDREIDDGMTDYEKELAIYQYLTKGMKATTGVLTVINSGAGEYSEPHDVLKHHSAVCVGYATTFRLLMQMLGIDCKVVHDSGLGHSWNLVKLDDGWYHVDCYMDADGGSFRNFNMDDAACAENHSWNRDFFPAADGKNYNYMLTICETLPDPYEIPGWVLDAFDAKKSAISCKFKTPLDADAQKLAEFMAASVQSQLANSESYYGEYHWTTDADGSYILCYYLSDSSDSLIIELPEGTQEKAQSALQKAFEDHGLFFDSELLPMESGEDYDETEADF